MILYRVQCDAWAHIYVPKRQGTCDSSCCSKEQRHTVSQALLGEAHWQPAYAGPEGNQWDPPLEKQQLYTLNKFMYITSDKIISIYISIYWCTQYQFQIMFTSTGDLHFDIQTIARTIHCIRSIQVCLRCCLNPMFSITTKVSLGLSFIKTWARVQKTGSLTQIVVTRIADVMRRSNHPLRPTSFWDLTNSCKHFYEVHIDRVVNLLIVGQEEVKKHQNRWCTPSLQPVNHPHTLCSPSFKARATKGS